MQRNPVAFMWKVQKDSHMYGIRKKAKPIKQKKPKPASPAGSAQNSPQKMPGIPAPIPLPAAQLASKRPLKLLGVGVAAQQGSPKRSLVLNTQGHGLPKP